MYSLDSVMRLTRLPWVVSDSVVRIGFILVQKQKRAINLAKPTNAIHLNYLI